jgi:predicted lactoylglutathione lyase
MHLTCDMNKSKYASCRFILDREPTVLLLHRDDFSLFNQIPASSRQNLNSIVPSLVLISNERVYFLG